MENEKDKKLDYLETADDVHTLAEFDNDKYYLRLDMCHYGLELHGHIRPKVSRNAINTTELKAIFDESGIKGFVNKPNILEFCKLANRGKEVSGMKLVRGVYPVQGDDERITFLVKPKSKNPHIHPHSDSKKDLETIGTNTFFDCVKKGDVIAYRSPPEEGICGTAVDGSEIPPINGRSLLKSPRAGNGAYLDKNTHKFIAKNDGCVVYDETRGIISVEEKLIIADDIDFIVGHIDFIGDVEIHGDVVDDLHIRSEKSIVVTGHVGECQLDAKGDITIGGMSGHGNGTVRCGGTFKARYINGVNLDALGDVVVTNEIIDSNVQTSSSIYCPAGRVIGGCYTALKGIEVGEIGSESNIPTKLIVGHSFIVHKHIKILQNKIMNYIKRLKAIAPKTKLYINSPDKLDALPNAQKDMIISLIAEEKKLLTLKLKTEERLKQEIKNVTTGANPIISANKGIWEGVKISFGITTETIRNDIYHPTSIIEDMITGHFKLISIVPISTKIEKLRTKYCKMRRKRQRR